jgi:hypothetical protein
MASAEIHMIQTISGNQGRIRRIIEEATQTFLPGTPVTLNGTDGGVQAWTQGATPICGFSKEAANNLGATGVIPTASVPGAQKLTFGSVPNETSAVNIGRPLFNDGRIGFEAAVSDTVFLGQVGPAQTVALSNVGKTYNLTKDSDNHWYVDLTNTTNLVATIIRVDPNDQSATPRGVYFVVTPAFQQVAG